jgi:3-oxoacyl-[acyl-carrier protein] reductase
MNTEKQKVVVITGGNSGIGRAIAEVFVQSRAQVVTIGRNKETLAATARILGAGVVWHQADVSDREQVATLIERITQQFQQIDVLVNAAGFTQPITTDLPLDEAEKLRDSVLDANLKGSFLMAMAVAPYLARPGGRIINMSSIGAFTGGSRAGALAYAASKAGVNGLTYALAR